MKHLEAMAQRLPQLYRAGALLNDVLAQAALQQMIVDEDLTRIQQAHFFELTRDFEEAVKLADLLGLQPEPESGMREFRSFAAAYRDAVRRFGTTTPATIRAFAGDHLTRFQAKLGIALVANSGKWRDEAKGVDFPSLVENPERRRILSIPPDQGGTPLQTFTIHNSGIEPSPLAAILKADQSAAEVSPCIVNLTTGSGLLFGGVLKPGQRLWLKPGAQGVSAQLEHRDLSTRLTSFSGWEQGKTLEASDFVQPAQPMTLAVGPNQLVFFPLAQYGQPGLNRFLLAMPDPELTQGRFNQAGFDKALFHQDRRVRLSFSWVERQRARFQVRLPMAAMVRKQNMTGEEASQARQRLLSSLNQGVLRLKAAGIEGSVQPRVHRASQLQMDFLRMIQPIKLNEGGVVGKVRKVSYGASFDKTNFDDSLMA